jgi:hypothetical protein
MIRTTKARNHELGQSIPRSQILVCHFPALIESWLMYQTASSNRGREPVPPSFESYQKLDRNRYGATSAGEGFFMRYGSTACDSLPMLWLQLARYPESWSCRHPCLIGKVVII